jgi:hypothetical protein
MAKELSENTSFQISIQTLIGIAFGIATVVGMWFALQADIEEAKELPVPPTTRCYKNGIRYERSINPSNNYVYSRRC